MLLTSCCILIYHLLVKMVYCGKPSTGCSECRKRKTRVSPESLSFITYDPVNKWVHKMAFLMQYSVTAQLHHAANALEQAALALAIEASSI